MQSFTQSLHEAFRLVAAFDGDLREIILLSLQVSGSALALAALIGLPLGAFLAMSRFRGRQIILTIVTALMGLPPVVVGLIVYLLLSNNGALGPLQLLYTPTAMVIAQTILIIPIITALTAQTIEQLHDEYRDQLTLFGISNGARIRTLLWEGRFDLATALLAGFGRSIAEVGAVIIVGGNINHVTRVMTTTIALETSKGNLSLALGLGLILIAISLTVNALLMILRNTAKRAAAEQTL